MSLSTPIVGNSNVIAGSSTTLSNSTIGGTWESSDITIATIDLNGVVVGIKSGTVVITYTVGGDDAIFALNVQPYNITNGFNLNLVVNALSQEILWKSQGSSNSGRYFQDFHALCDENLIKNLSQTLGFSTPQYEAYLSSLNQAVILECVNSIFNQFQLIDRCKLVFDRFDYRLYLQIVPNQSQLVGITFSVYDGDFALAFKNILLFFNKAITFNLYLYNDMLDLPVITIPVTTLANQQTVIPVTGQMQLVFNYLSNTIKGGRWFLSYYQDDIEAQGANAMFYNIGYTKFKAFSVMAFSSVVVPSPNPPYGRNFDRYNIGANNLMYGMNVEAISYVDPTENIIQNHSLWGDLIGYVGTAKIIEMIIFSYRNNKVQVNIMGNDYLDKLYIELNAVESSNPNELNFTNGLRKKIEEAKRIVKQGFQKKNKAIAGCG